MTHLFLGKDYPKHSVTKQEHLAKVLHAINSVIIYALYPVIQYIMFEP